MIKIIIIFLSLVVLLVSCEQNKNCTDKEKIVYLESSCYKTDSTLDSYTQNIIIFNYEYSDSNRYIINKWKDSLHQNIKDSLLSKKFIIHKTYFLSNIILNNEEKVQDIQEFNHKLEKHISLKIGYLQGIPTVLFSTSIENLNSANPQKKEYFTIQIKRFLY